MVDPGFEKEALRRNGYEQDVTFLKGARLSPSKSAIVMIGTFIKASDLRGDIKILSL